jgi:hypothetical protein
MTSKTLVRMAEDIDDTALSYAEIKALATGNPLIIEKCQLEMDVGRLKILHASHLNQKYSLEDKILKEYPQEIKRLTEIIRFICLNSPLAFILLFARVWFICLFHYIHYSILTAVCQVFF